MDNPQHYQPLSHALNPPILQPQYEEEEEGDDEGAIEEQLEREDDDGDQSNRAVPRAPNVNGAGKQRAEPAPSIPPQPSDPPVSEDVERKRRPGRPRGSKNRRIRSSGTERDASATSSAAAKQPSSTHGFHQYPTPPAPGEVHPHNQQYYEFQWRILNLCAEFYGAAEELIKATPSLVIAQCYQMGPGVKVDPLTMLSDAKRICDTLLTSPARLTAHPPPVSYPFIPGYTPLAPQPPQPPIQPTPPPSTNGKPPLTTQTGASVISNPQSFVVSMGHQHPAPQQYIPAMYSTPTYPTAPYYGYSGYSSFYPSVPAPQPGPSNSTVSNGSVGPPGSAGNQGAWSEEETEKLKRLAEEHRNSNGEIAWDALCEKWGNSRTRHQILIKATSLGLKESSSRGTKRRRDTESQLSSDRPPPSVPTPGAENTQTTPTTSSAPPPPQSTAPVQQNTHPPAPPSQSVPPPNSAQPSASPAPSTPATSTQPSPAIRHAQTQQQSTATRSFPYPMPTVAAATSPVISTTTPPQPQQRSGSANDYYRRPNAPAGSGPKPPGHGVTTHQYMYQPNGRREN